MRTIVIIAAIILSAAAADAAPQEPVKLTDDGAYFTLTNGIVTTRIDKHSASLATLQYKDHELLGPMGIDGFWALPASNMEFGSKRSATVTLDPKNNDGERAIVSVNFTYD